MLYGFYTAASGMLLNQKKLNVNANNIANLKTPGFKASLVTAQSYDQANLTRYDSNGQTVIGTSTPLSYAEEVNTNFDPSLISETGRSLDFAINGQGYFNIQTENGRLLTRNGQFDIDNEGYLILPGYGRVLGENGPLQVGGSNFTILKNGAVYDENAVNIGTLLITQPGENAQLTQVENGLFTTNNLNNLTQLENATVEQFMLENNNVDLNKEMASVMESQRAFEACSRVLKSIDQINAKTVSEIARI